MKIHLYRASNLPSLFWPLFHSGSQFLAPMKKCRFLRFIHNTNNNNYHFHHHHHQLLQTVFSEYTEAATTSLVPIDAILPEICTFIDGFSCTAWTKMKSLRAH